jgi:hypothetical protein
MFRNGTNVIPFIVSSVEVSHFPMNCVNHPEGDHGVLGKGRRDHRTGWLRRSQRAIFELGSMDQ